LTIKCDKQCRCSLTSCSGQFLRTPKYSNLDNYFEEEQTQTSDRGRTGRRGRELRRSSTREGNVTPPLVIETRTWRLGTRNSTISNSPRREGDAMTCWGRLFHTRDAGTGNDRSPTVVRRIRRTTSMHDDAEQCLHRAWESVGSWN